MQKIKLKIVGLSFHQMHKDGYILILSEEQGKRRLPIVIGGFEAQSIAKTLEHAKTERPLTHDTFHAFAQSFDIVVTEVLIHKFQDGIFYSTLYCKRGEQKVELDSRSSDAIALAIRFDAPIYTNEATLSEAGIDIELIEEDEEDYLEEGDEEAGDDESTDEVEENRSLASYSLAELQTMLEESIKNEAYERASYIRDEINSRNAEEAK